MLDRFGGTLKPKWRYITRIPSKGEDALSGPLAWISQAERDALMKKPPEERISKLKKITKEIKRFKGEKSI